jgi:Na+-transporting methylmalonyl-CoA/oxaloacetate decarboxylase gamma subunit
MRVLLLLVFLVFAIALLATLAYRFVSSEMRAKRRALRELDREPTPEELYAAGRIDLAELERRTDRELERKRRR